MNLRSLRYFVVTAEEANFGRAAKRLHITQPTLSLQIQDLEKEIGVKLFDRLPRGVRLTEAGGHFLSEAGRMLGELDQAIVQTRRVGRGEIGTLRIAFSEISCQQSVVAKALRRFRDIHPDIALELLLLSSSEQQQALDKGAVDAGFCHLARGPDAGIATFHLQTDHYVLAVSKYDPMAKRARISLADLSARTLLWAYRRSGTDNGEETQSYFSSLGLPVARLIQTGSDAAAINLASVGMGIGLVLSSQRFGSSPDVVYKELPGTPRNLNAVLAWRKDNDSPPLRHFIELLRGLVAAARKPVRKRR